MKRASELRSLKWKIRKLTLTCQFFLLRKLLDLNGRLQNAITEGEDPTGNLKKEVNGLSLGRFLGVQRFKWT